MLVLTCIFVVMYIYPFHFFNTCWAKSEHRSDFTVSFEPVLALKACHERPELRAVSSSSVSLQAIYQYSCSPPPHSHVFLHLSLEITWDHMRSYEVTWGHWRSHEVIGGHMRSPIPGEHYALQADFQYSYTPHPHSHVFLPQIGGEGGG